MGHFGWRLKVINTIITTKGIGFGLKLPSPRHDLGEMTQSLLSQLYVYANPVFGLGSLYGDIIMSVPRLTHDNLL